MHVCQRPPPPKASPQPANRTLMTASWTTGQGSARRQRHVRVLVSWLVVPGLVRHASGYDVEAVNNYDLCVMRLCARLPDRLAAVVRTAGAVMGIVLLAGCSGQSAPSHAVKVQGLWQFCQKLPFPGGGTHDALEHTSGVETLCARWRDRGGITTLYELKGSFQSTSGTLTDPSLQFRVETIAHPFARVLVPWTAVTALVKPASEADTGWFPAARLTGHDQGPLSWRRGAAYLKMWLSADNHQGVLVPVGGTGFLLDPGGQEGN
jgi:hypothetical protein